MVNEVSQNQTNVFSFKYGLSMPFLYKGEQVIVNQSAWTPREKIYVNDDLVVNRWSLSMDSTQVINVAGDQLILTYGLKKDWETFFLTAKVGNEIVHQANYKIREHNEFSKHRNLTIFACFLAGGVGGYFLAKYFLGVL